MTSPETISVILFTFWPEEEKYIEACLRTVSWASEIVVIDNGASEKTIKICRKYTDKIFKTTSDDFAQHHNFGKEKATGDWLLYVDADERVSAALASEIKRAIAKPEASAFALCRVNYFLGKEVIFGDRYPDYVTRLFKKDKLIGWEGEIHESSKVSGIIGQLKSPLYHLTHRDIYSMMDKTKNFAEHEANLRLKIDHPRITGWRLIRVLITETYTRLIKYQGIRGGTEGIVDGIFQAFSLFISYVRLWERQQKPTLPEKYRELDKKILAEFS